MKTSAALLVALFTVAACAASAQEPPTPPPSQPPVTPPPTQPPTEPPAGQNPTPPAATPPPAVPASVAEAPARTEFTDGELRRRRDAIYLMEGLLVNTVKLAATRTQSRIEEAVPDLSVTLFSSVSPQANGIHLDDYGVVFNVIIPTYQPSVVNILSMLPRGGSDAAQQTAATRTPDIPLNPNLIYVETVRSSLIDAMLKFGQSLELRPFEWLAIAARGADGGPGPVSEPSVPILRVKGSDLNDFLAGRVSRDEVEKRVQMKPFSGRR